MAWQAYLASKLVPVNAGGSLVSVFYYDDADPLNAGVGLAGPGNGTAAASTDLISVTAHGLVAGNQVIFTALTGGVGLQLDTPYYVIAAGLTANAFSVSTRQGGTAAVDITTNATAVTAFKLTPPAVVLYQQTFPLAVGKTISDLLPDIDRAGQQMRVVQQQADTINTQIPIGTIRAVPA